MKCSGHNKEERVCYILGKCVLDHPLVGEDRMMLVNLLNSKHTDNGKTYRVLQLFFSKEPPKYYKTAQVEKLKRLIQKRRQSMLTTLYKRRYKNHAEAAAPKSKKKPKTMPIYPPAYLNLNNFIKRFITEPEPDFHEK